jgi:hypothetical protein
MAYPSLSGNPVVPEATKLQRDAILESMLEHISEYQRADKLVDIGTLKEYVIQKVVDAPKDDNDVRFDEETQLRGFLVAFARTVEYSSQFKLLDERTQEQIETFKDKPATWKHEKIWKDTERKGFQLPLANDKSSRPLAALVSEQITPGRFKTLLRGLFVKAARPLVLLLLKVKLAAAARKLEKKQASLYSSRLTIYEDSEESQPMTVF